MAQEWFYTNDGKNKVGPLSSSALQAHANAGQLLPSDMVWKDGMSQWAPASAIKGLFAHVRVDEPPDPIGDEADQSDFRDGNDATSVRRRHRSSSAAGKSFLDFLLLKWMISPSLLVVLFWLGVVGFVCLGLLYMVFGAFGAQAGGGAWSLVLGISSGLAMMIIGPVVLRVYFELAIVVFRIYETLVEIRDDLQ